MIKKIITITECNKWNDNKYINPFTKRKITEKSVMYKKLDTKCPKLILKTKNPNKNITESACNKWNNNKYINPFTKRKMTEKSVMYKKLDSKCPKKLDINKKIGKLFLPFINRISANITDRINYYLLLRKYIKYINNKYENNCLRVYKYDSDNKPIYRIGNRIILRKQIGSNSANGIVFLSYYRPPTIINKSIGKFNRFAVKIFYNIPNNRKEIEILNTLTKAVIYLKCPHFPITYGTLKCDNSRPENISKYNSENSNNSLLKNRKDNNYPKFIKNFYDKRILFQLNELANGDFKNYIEHYHNNELFILNAISQIFISLMFFHNTIKAFHSDAHFGNFLFHKVKPGGYFHYNIHGVDYYLENIGYLWVIWDFGLIRNFKDPTKVHRLLLTPIIYDYMCIMYFCINKNNNTNDGLIGYVDNKYIFNDKINTFISTVNNNVIKKYKNNVDVNDFALLENDLLIEMCKYIPTFTTKKPSKVINKKPYII